ncbi:SRPBCC family protein [Maribacter sp. 2-571]|uniref:SRPBCC family protein n=1 Tax=Maribacter sp. 2-571 TaxID=3417569 RepID=UPI003D32CF56
MKRGIQTQHHIKAPITTVWDFIKTGAQWEQWLPILSGSQVNGNKRTCEIPTPDGGKDVMEELFLVSDIEKTFVYQVHKQASFPAEDIVGYIRLEEKGADTALFWSVEMNVASEEVFNQLKGQIEHIYSESTSNLEQLATALI